MIKRIILRGTKEFIPTIPKYQTKTWLGDLYETFINKIMGPE
jgi:hypothetical protein